MNYEWWEEDPAPKFKQSYWGWKVEETADRMSLFTFAMGGELKLSKDVNLNLDVAFL